MLRGSAARLALAGLLAAAVLATPAPALAALQPQEALTYLPTELIHSTWTPAQLDGFLAELDSYRIGQALLQMPRFRTNGTLNLPAGEKAMLPVWAHETAVYNEVHATEITAVAVFNGVPKTGGLSLEKPGVRAHILAAVESVLASGIGGVQLDIEPYPRTAGFLALLEALDGAFSRLGFRGRLSVVAPGGTSTWAPSYLQSVASLVDQVDPTYYDSELATRSAYQSWIQESLAYYSANVRAATRIIPVLPSYSANPWHDPSVENIASASGALEGALLAGSRVNGAGIWWWYGFFDDERGRYDASADRAAWLQSTLALPFSP